MTVYFVAGASRGIGFTLVKKILELNKSNKVIAGVRDFENSEKLYSNIVKLYGQRIFLVKLDIDSTDNVKEAEEKISAAFPEGIDYLMLTAGTTGKDNTHEGILSTFNTNTVGALRVVQASLPLLRKGKCKKAMLVTSLGGTFAEQELLYRAGLASGNNLLGYRLSKCALNLLAVALSKENQDDGITIFAAHPGAVWTDMMKSNMPKDGSDITSIPNIPGIITPEESASCLLNLIEKVTLADTGKLFKYDGTSLPW